MNDESVIKRYGVRYKELAERLSQYPQVSRYDSETNREAWTLAHSFLDLAESFQRFLSEQLPALEQRATTPERTIEILQDIGDEFRHIEYHLRQPQYFRHFLVPNNVE